MNIAAIDIGSNAIRMAISSVANERITQLERLRTPIRLGQDVFTRGKISEGNLKAVAETFKKYSKLIDKYDVDAVRATATSAARETSNQEEFTQRIFKSSGITIEIIDALEEARLIQIAVAEKLVLKRKNCILMDIGGGSVELVAIRNEKIEGIETYKMGTVRALNHAKKKNLVLKDYIYSFKEPMRNFIDSHFKWVDLIIGTGGNIECMGRLRCREFQKRNTTHIRRKEVSTLAREMAQLTPNERIDHYELRKDRADVILPALHSVKLLMKCTQVDTLEIPRVGLRDGITLDLAKRLDLIASENGAQIV